MCLDKLASGLPGGTGGGSIGGVHLNDPLDISGGQKRRDAAAAEKRARAEEELKRAAIEKNIAGINAAYDSRGAQYAQLGDALREQGNTALARQSAEAGRQTKFALARSGNTGGSVALDRGRDLNRANTEGALAVERGAQKGVADLKSQDEASRVGLINLAQTGGNVGNGAEQAARLMQASLQGAQNNVATQGLGEAFAGISNYYKRSQDNKNYLAGLKSVSPYGTQPSGIVGPR